MKQEIACRGTKADTALHVGSVPFDELPKQSRLFLQYQTDPLSLRRFYPSAVASHADIAENIPSVLENFTTDRSALCSALDEINREIEAGPAVFENIARLAEQDCVAVVTGQQAGLFTGPLYTIYKALSVVKAAECLRGRGFKAVPVFWAATEDHDFEEVSAALVPDRGSSIVRIASNVARKPDQPVGSIKLDSSIGSTVDSLFDALKPTEFTNEMRGLVENAWTEGVSFGRAFSRMISALMSDYGLVVVDPLHPGLKRLAAPIYVQAVRRSREIVEALVARSNELVDNGFEAQVAVDEDYFPLFYHSDTGERLSLRRTAKGTFSTRRERLEFTLDELAALAEKEPARFSPGVMLRPAVQDFILPTICYFGGRAEIAYFAQNSEVYRILERPVPTILHRQSFTVVEARHCRTLERYGLRFADLFRGIEDLLPQIVDEHLDRSTALTFAEVEEIVNAQLNRLDRELTGIDPTLAENLATRRRKIIYHIGALQRKFRSAQLKRDETIHRQIGSMFGDLVPGGHLQERSINVTYFLNRYGRRFIDWIYDAVDLDDTGHRVIYL